MPPAARGDSLTGDPAANFRKNLIWDAYWHDSRINSDGPDGSPAIEAALAAHWAQATEPLASGASVLDLACGNGFVSLAVVRAAQKSGKVISVVGVDAAQINPHRYVTQHAALLKPVDFRPLTSMEALPFEAGTFDAVFSQYGIEYGDLTRCVAELSRVLKSGGTAVILAFPAGSSLLERAMKKKKQAQFILDQTKLIDVASVVAQALHNIESVSADGNTKQYLDRFNIEVEKTMGKFGDTDSDMVVAVVFALQNTLTMRKEMDIAKQLASIANVRQRLTNFIARTDAMARAALGEAALNGLKRRLAEAGLVGLEMRPLSAGDEGTVAWRIAAKKA